MTKLLVRTYLRDNRNPFPGKIVEEKIIKAPSPIFGVADAESRVESKTMRELRTAADIAERFEALVDSATEGGYQ